MYKPEAQTSGKTDTLTFDMNRSFSTGFMSRVGLPTCSFYTLDLPELIQFLGKLFVEILVHNKKQYVITHSTTGSYKSSLVGPVFYNSRLLLVIIIHTQIHLPRRREISTFNTKVLHQKLIESFGN